MQLFFKLLFLLVLPLQLSSQSADDIIAQLQLKMSSVNDYAVDATIRSDIPLIKILPVRATIYFKQKDKFRIVSKGIAILPKQGFMDISKLLSPKDSYDAIVAGSELISNIKTEIITILPNSDTTDLILAKLWIDTTNDIVLKSQITTRTNGTVSIEYTYKSQLNFGLPDNMVFTVDVKKFKIPKGVVTDINRATIEEIKPPAKTGKIYIQLTNYKINKGVSDDVFKK